MRSIPGRRSPISIAGVCFILALRGLSVPGVEPARQSLRHDRHDDRGGDDAARPRADDAGARGRPAALPYQDEPFAIAAQLDVATLGEILLAIAIGATIGLVTARRIAMTAMPQLVAAFHSLVGLAAVLVACAAFLNPEAFGIVDAAGQILTVSRVEMGLGVAIGAITFSGIGHRLPEA